MVALAAGMLFTGQARSSWAASDAHHDGGAVVLEGPASAADATSAAVRVGTIIVRNHSNDTVDVYLKRDDGSSFTTSDYVNTVPPGYRLRIRRVRRGRNVLAATVAGDSQIGWGPRAFRLRALYTWTLLP